VYPVREVPGRADFRGEYQEAAGAGVVSGVEIIVFGSPAGGSSSGILLKDGQTRS
jgi:hypothetical protein